VGPTYPSFSLPYPRLDYRDEAGTHGRSWERRAAPSPRCCLPMRGYDAPPSALLRHSRRLLWKLVRTCMPDDGRAASAASRSLAPACPSSRAPAWHELAAPLVEVASPGPAGAHRARPMHGLAHPAGARGRAPRPTDLASLAGGDVSPTSTLVVFRRRRRRRGGGARQPAADVTYCGLLDTLGHDKVRAAWRRRPPWRQTQRCADSVFPSVDHHANLREFM
jgi:hypothetical protein